MINGADSQSPILVLDFDGTVCIGDAPVWAYANEVLDGISETNGDRTDQFRQNITNGLAAFLDGQPGINEYSDGYDAVAQLSAPHTTPQRLQHAYATSRRALANGSLDVETPPGLADFLREIHRSVTTVLVTNAPDVGVQETVQTLGIDTVIDQIVTDAAKPRGWQQLLPPLLQERTPATVMVVGDIWANDIAIPLEYGCATAYIDRFDQRRGPAHTVARAFPPLYSDLRLWATDPLDFVATHPPDQKLEPQSGTAPTHRTGTQ